MIDVLMNARCAQLFYLDLHLFWPDPGGRQNAAVTADSSLQGKPGLLQ